MFDDFNIMKLLWFTIHYTTNYYQLYVELQWSNYYKKKKKEFI